MNPSRERLLRYFDYRHLPPALQDVSSPFSDLAWLMVQHCEDTQDPDEVTAGLRKLLEAKDCFVRAMLP